MEAKMNNYNTWIKYQDETKLKETIERMLNGAGFKIVGYNEYFFPIQGFTGVWLLSESHLAIHSFPEEDKIYIELSSCVDTPFQLMVNMIKRELA